MGKNEHNIQGQKFYTVRSRQDDYTYYAFSNVERQKIQNVGSGHGSNVERLQNNVDGRMIWNTRRITI